VQSLQLRYACRCVALAVAEFTMSCEHFESDRALPKGPGSTGLHAPPPVLNSAPTDVTCDACGRTVHAQDHAKPTAERLSQVHAMVCCADMCSKDHAAVSLEGSCHANQDAVLDSHAAHGSHCSSVIGLAMAWSGVAVPKHTDGHLRNRAQTAAAHCSCPNARAAPAQPPLAHNAQVQACCSNLPAPNHAAV
jgi:hypothetical protein